MTNVSHGVAVIVPTYERKSHLENCLRGLLQQSIPPVEIVVVCRSSDRETLLFVQNLQSEHDIIRCQIVSRPGLVAALNKGLEAVSAGIVGFTDDDAVAHSDWIETAICHFSDPLVAGVGGKDNIYREGKLVEGNCRTVGKVSWFGRLVGNHHLGASEVKEVDVLKGVNMFYRQDVIKRHGFDPRLKGKGTQLHSEVMLGLKIRKEGYKLIYDPKLVVEHYHAPRTSGDVRHSSESRQVSERVFNETLAISESMGWCRRAVCVMYFCLLGTGESPGIVQFFRLVITRGWPVACRVFRAALHARFLALREVCTVRSRFLSSFYTQSGQKFPEFIKRFLDRVLAIPPEG